MTIVRSVVQEPVGETQWKVKRAYKQTKIGRERDISKRIRDAPGYNRSPTPDTRSRNRSNSPEDSGSRRHSRKGKSRSSRKKSRRERSVERYRDRPAVAEGRVQQYTDYQRARLEDLARAMKYATSAEQCVCVCVC